MRLKIMQLSGSLRVTENDCNEKQGKSRRRSIRARRRRAGSRHRESGREVQYA